MGQPYIGEIRMWPVGFAPVGWAFCSGQLVAISENDALYQLLGTTYGGDGQNTFALPDLQGRIPIHQSTTSLLGESAGSESVTLTVQQLPIHTHPLAASTTVASDTLVDNNMLAQASTFDPYNASIPPATPMAPGSVGFAGGSQPHDNFQPYLCVNFIISLYGIFPAPSM